MENKKYKEMLDRAMVLCSKSEKCKRDIKSKLSQWGLDDEEMTDKIIIELGNHDFINEKRYSLHFVSEKHSINKWGRIKISSMLKSRGIPDSLISQAIQSINQEEYAKSLKDELSKKRNTLKARNQYDLKGKLLRFAQSRGYEFDLIMKLINEIIQT